MEQLMKTGSACFILYKNETILIHRDTNERTINPDTNGLPGGGFDRKKDRNELDTIVRELFEELRLDIRENRFKKVGTEWLTELHLKNHFFKLNLTEHEVAKIRLKEGKTYDFFSFSKIQDLYALGPIPGGLGGAIWRFMCNEPEIIEDILLGKKNTFVLDRK